MRYLKNKGVKKGSPKTTKAKVEGRHPGPLVIKRGKLVRLVSYSTIRFLTGVSIIFLLGNILFSFKLFSSSVSISSNLGTYINMVSKGDGHILPSLQALPVLVFLIIDIVLIFVTFKIFEPVETPKMNRILFLLIMVSLGLICVTLILLFVVIQHMYGSHEGLHNGITEAMSNYAENSVYKKRIDRLQIDFQCCGSKKYDEWYNITWYDTSLAKNNAIDNSLGHTPFSCCSMTSIFPCIHHNIENTGKVYLYTPELNLSISTDGCYVRIRHKKQEIGWGIVGNLFLYMISQGALIISLRFLQTGHFENSKFDGHKRLYTVWLIGCYAGRTGEVVEGGDPPKIEKSPPEVPPLPPELMEEETDK